MRLCLIIEKNNKGLNKFLYSKKQNLSLKIPLSQIEKKILLEQIKMGTKEWSYKNANCIQGCGVCIYCYAKAMAKIWRGISEDQWTNKVIKWEKVNKGYRKIINNTNAPWDYMFPTSHNIFIEEPYFSACVRLLKKLLQSKNTVLVTLKSFPKVIHKLCEEFYQYRNQMAFRFTITSVNNEILKSFQPKGPSFEESVESVQFATESGFSTTISAEPLLDLYPYELIDQVEPYLSSVNYLKDIGTIWVGLLKIKYIPKSLRKGKVLTHLNKLIPTFKFEHVYKYYEKLYNHPRIRWKESIIKLMIQNNIKVKGITD